MIYLSHLDILEFLNKLENNSIDLFFTSPPYNLKNKGGDVVINTYFDKWENLEYENWQIEILNLMRLKLKPHGAIFYNHKNRYEKNKVISPWSWILKSNLNLNQCIIWDRITSVDNNRGKFKPTTELVFWLYKDSTFKLKQEAVSFNEVWKIKRPSPSMNMGHNATFPPQLVERVLISLDTNLKNGFTICDPFAGTGTVAQVSEYLKIPYCYLNDKFLDKDMIFLKCAKNWEHEELPIIKNKYRGKNNGTC